jgi:capsular exopolysaccharide synthesis family protein
VTSDLQFQEFIDILRRRKRLILMVAAASMALATAGALLIPPRYTAKAQIIIEPQPGSHIGEPAPVVVSTTEDVLIPTQVATLLSRDYMERVRNSLADDPAFRAADETRALHRLADDAAWERTVDAARSWLMAWLPASWRPDTETAPAPLQQDAAPVRPAKREIPSPEEFERRLKVFQEAGSHVIAASYTSQDPATAAAVANRVVERYIEGQTEQRRAATSRELAWLEERIPVLRTEVDRAELIVGNYQASRGFAASNLSVANDLQIADLSRQLAVAEADFAARQARLAYIRGLRQRGSGTDRFLETLNSPMLTELHHQEVALLQTEAELAATVGASNPKLLQVRSRLQYIQGKLGQETERSVSNLENEAQIAGRPVNALRSQLALISDARADMRLHDLEHDVATKRQLYSRLVQRREEVRGQQDILRPDARILSFATPPDRPSSANPVLFIFPAFVMSLIGGSMLAVLAERLDRRLRSQRDINETLGIPCIAMVPQLRRVGQMRPHQNLLAKPLAAYAEAFRSIVATLQLTAPQRAPKVVLITSSVPGEGKTTLAVSLASYMASLGRRVLLIDLDFRHSTILRELGGTANGGVLDLLDHDGPSAEVIQHLPELRLDYLPVCRRPADPFALFASQQMSQLLAKLREEYDCVIVDSPPLLAITEARLLAAMADKVLFVVKWGSTPRHAAQNALSLLRGVNGSGRGRDNLAGAVMTQVNLKKHARGRYGDVAESFVRYKQYYLES